MRRLAALLLAPAALTACGGDGGDALSKAEFIKQADAICTKFDRELRAIPQPKEASEIGAYAKRAAPIARQGVEDLRDLEAEDGFADQAKALIDGLDSDTDLFEQLGKAADADDRARIEQIAAEAEKRTTERQRQAESAGFKQCGIEDTSS